MTNSIIMQVLIVLTSHSELGHTGNKIGVWLQELAAPYYDAVFLPGSHGPMWDLTRMPDRSP